MAIFTLFVLFMFALGVYSEKCKECQFQLRSINGELCAKLNASIVIEDPNKNSNDTMCVPCSNDAHNETGACNTPKHDKKYLRNTLHLKWDDDYGNFNYTLQFNFTQRTDKNNQQWWMDAVEFITQDDDDDTVTYFNGTMDNFPKLDYRRSFKCNSNTEVNLVPVDGKGSNVSMILSNFRVQAFNFSGNDYTKNPYVCNSDTSGSKIVPIAVGAALAFLIIVVLIAFVVGRIINRQKNTYEPLN